MALPEGISDGKPTTECQDTSLVPKQSTESLENQSNTDMKL